MQKSKRMKEKEKKSKKEKKENKKKRKKLLTKYMKNYNYWLNSSETGTGGTYSPDGTYSRS